MKKHLALCFFILLALCACEQNSGDHDNKINTGVLSIQMDVQQIPGEVVQISGLLSREGFDPIRFEFEVTDHSATKLIEAIAVGVWKVRIDAHNNRGDIACTAATEVLVEANEVTPVYIHLMKTGSVEIIVTWGDDQFEENDIQEDAAAIWEYHYYEDLYVSMADDDWYSIDLSADSVSIICEFQHDKGDINVDLVDSHGNVLKSAKSKTDHEVFSYIVHRLDTYYIHVYSLSNKSNRYTIWWDDIFSGQ